jgi:hypothetical protein
MKRLLFALVALFTTATAEAQCRFVRTGEILRIYNGPGLATIYAPSFTARAVCTRNTPFLARWMGGAACVGRTIYGWNAARQPFSCRLVRFGW